MKEIEGWKEKERWERTVTDRATPEGRERMREEGKRQSKRERERARNDRARERERKAETEDNQSE